MEAANEVPHPAGQATPTESASFLSAYYQTSTEGIHTLELIL
jgi:hypothetical protein